LASPTPFAGASSVPISPGDDIDAGHNRWSIFSEPRVSETLDLETGEN
jgi:hypothetical protein